MREFLVAVLFLFTSFFVNAASMGRTPRYELEATVDSISGTLSVKGTIDFGDFQSEILVLSPHCLKPTFTSPNGDEIQYSVESVEGDDSRKWPGQRLKRKDRMAWKDKLSTNYHCKRPAAPAKETRSDFTIHSQSFRLSEATNWYPTLPLGTNNTPSVRGVGRIKVNCIGCKGKVWANSQSREEVGNQKIVAHYRVATDFHIWSYPDLKFTQLESLAGPLLIMSINWDKKDVKKIKSYVEEVLSFYAKTFGKINRSEALYFSQIKPIPARVGWAYSASTNAFLFSADGVEPGELKPETSSIAHELAHRYFDGEWPVVGENGRAFLSESFAENLSQIFILSKKKPGQCASIDSDREILKKQLKDLTDSSLVSVQYSDKYYSTLVYELGPLILWDFCGRIGFDKYQAWIRNILSPENKSIDLDIIRKASKSAGVSEENFLWLQTAIEKPVASYFK